MLGIASFTLMLAAVGAGCASDDATTPPESTPPAATSTMPNQPSSPTSSDSGTPVIPDSSATSVNPGSVDTTGWETYTNATIGYSFQYPTKGTFAPEFNVQTLPNTHPFIKDGCYDNGDLGPMAQTDRVAIGGETFCRTRTLEGAAGSTYNNEYWVTSRGNWSSVIIFTKRYVTDPRIIGGCEDGGADVGTAKCRGFDLQGYQHFIEQIMSTLRYPNS